MSSNGSRPLPDLPARDPDGHKGTFGSVCVVGGCAQALTPMIGAPVLAGRGAFRAGAGLVKLAMPGAILPHAIQMLHSATGIGLRADFKGRAVLDAESRELIQSADAIVLGPGLGPDDDGVVHALVRDVIGMGRPTVVDADALNALAGKGAFDSIDLRRCVLTPHPGEFSRLTGALRLGDAGDDAESRRRAAGALAERLSCVVVLKGARTVVAEGSSSWTCEHGHPCMATAGTGDVLAGVIASLIAQSQSHGLSNSDAARIGVKAHAIAGERWAARCSATGGMLAEELADELPAVITSLRSA